VARSKEKPAAAISRPLQATPKQGEELKAPARFIGLLGSRSAQTDVIGSPLGFVSGTVDESSVFGLTEKDGVASFWTGGLCWDEITGSGGRVEPRFEAFGRRASTGAGPTTGTQPVDAVA